MEVAMAFRRKGSYIDRELLCHTNILDCIFVSCRIISGCKEKNGGIV